ncbi:MAG: glycosyltransferase [Rhodoferax sp.]|jgi:glycosyltransferase involved in cell wall biosynthesis|nr:glycosyltransferase [Rhodoferax sp.]
MASLQVVHLSTVHPRNDTRIFIKQVHTLHAALAVDVALVVADGKGDQVANGAPSVFDLGKLPASRSTRALAGNWRALKFLWRARPRVVHFHDPELIPLGFLLRLRGCKVVYDVHEDVPRQTMSKHWIPVVFRWPVALVTAGMEWLAARAFSAVVPATPVIGARFPAGKTVLVQNFPIQSELVIAVPQPYSERPQMFAYVGGIADIRGGVEMVQAFESLGDHPQAYLEMAGGISPQSFMAELQGLAAWKGVRYRGSLGRSEVASMLGSARAGLVLFHPMPNHVDAQPNKMFEYMSAGLPVIASDFPLWRQIVSGADCGLLVDPMDPTAIAGAMRWILEHPAEAERMGQNGKRAVHDMYNWARESVGLVDLYRRLLAA